MARTTLLAPIALLTTGSLLLSGCSLFDSEGPPPVEEDFPYTREGHIFQDTGNDEKLRFSVTALERTPDYTVMHYEVSYPDGFEGSNRNLSMANTLVDPMTGKVFREYTDEEGLKYGSASPNGDGLYPVFDGVTNEYRRYFPRLPDKVDQVTFIGSGLGAMTGIPVQDVEEDRSGPQDPNGPEHLTPDDPPDGENLTFENRPPEDGAEADTGWVESFVDSDIASITRDGDRETISLHSDVMFEFDESDLTEEAEDVVRQASDSLANNVEANDSEITIVGHTDSKGTDAYNQNLSEERARTVRELLVEELGNEYSYEVEGRGSTEPIAVEGGPDDEEARARNRRVEFSYDVTTPGSQEEGDDDGLGVAQRTVTWPAPFTEDNGDVVASEEREDVQLEVYPLRRDGAYVIATVALTNNSDEPVIPDMGADGSAQAGGPEQFSSGSLGGLQLLDPESDLERYVAQMNLEGGTSSGFAEEVHELQPGNTYDLVAVFAAPPEGTEELTLRAGPFGELEEIPIEE
ncbi:outer membrane protein OmpA-like peptidoglycan-associated protein [Haloactinospora alba]|uniref:Outer membrane protein OmpA-like peptidoglycan-associated protein n=1 Tax=Haloactinospora alba TaxID=405555 RepID=A0A543NLB2_9ACTN|nr:OmpA family protein [Haloactinospora alba]TQN32620.1 outer membrane protein OmpA-like peptidoglycan-associated protein [Haloactinospora alba]